MVANLCFFLVFNQTFLIFDVSEWECSVIKKISCFLFRYNNNYFVKPKQNQKRKTQKKKQIVDNSFLHFSFSFSHYLWEQIHIKRRTQFETKDEWKGRRKKEITNWGILKMKKQNTIQVIKGHLLHHINSSFFVENIKRRI